MEHPSGHQNAVVAVFTRHQDAEEAVRKLASGGFDMTHYSIVGQGFHSEEWDRGRERRSSSPPSEPAVQFSRDGLSSQLFPHRDWRAD